MSISTEKAYEILHLPLGSPRDAIEQSYKKLAAKWHPSSNKNPEESFKKFKSINIAYRKLMFNDRDLKSVTIHDLFEQFRQVFHQNDKKHHIDSTDNQSKNQKTSQVIGVFGNEIPINSMNKRSNAAGSHHSIKQYMNDKNNNNEENYENRNNVSSGRREEIKQKVKQLAIRGNEMAKQADYHKAIECFSDAISYDTKDHRLFLNRSYCYDKLDMFSEALSDAESAIKLEPTWPKGYYRKGRALSGLKAYKEAEKAYEKVLEIENNLDDPELEEELIKVRTHQLMEMGFSKIHAETAIKTYSTVANALEAIFTYPESEKSNESCSDIDNNELDLNENDSDNYDMANIKIKSNNSTASSSSNYSSSSSGENKPSSQDKIILNTDSVTANNNPPSTSLWIGNVDPTVSQTTLVELFRSNGHHLINVRCLPEKYCAFVNFKTKEESARAMQSLQGKPFHGQRLLIKYPDNQVNHGYKPFKNAASVAKKDPKKEAAEKAAAAAAAAKKKAEASAKLSGPVNGNECYFWRTTGCIYGDKCKYDHVKKNKGIDKKPWQK